MQDEGRVTADEIGAALRALAGCVLLVAAATLVVGLTLASIAFASGEPADPPSAYATGALDKGEPRVAATLLVAAGVVAGTVRVGVEIDVAPGWHIYWRNPGDTGLATDVRLRVDRADVAPVVWPPPEAFVDPGGLATFGHEGRVVFSSVATLHADDGPRALHADVDVLACRTQCLPASLTLRLDLADALRDEAATFAAGSRFDEASAERPVPSEALGVELTARWDRVDGAPDPEPRTGTLEVRHPDVVGARLFPDTPALEVRPTGVDPAEVGLTLTFEGRPTSANEVGLTGVVELEWADGSTDFAEIDVPFAQDSPSSANDEAVTAASTSAQAGPKAAVSYWHALLLAFVGGLLLNAMPCVLPVLAIKIFAITDLAERGRREVLAAAAAYTVGIVLSMLALAAVVLALRAAGTAVGWGFQFQTPAYALAVGALLVLFALNLFGAFEISAPTSRLARFGEGAHGSRRSFFEGLLAVALATPCTAPFLGTAAGLAFASPAPTTVAIFVAVGLGLAAPFCAVSLVPGFARFVPRPGAWMLELRRGLGLTLLASSVWLLWVIRRSVGVDGLVFAAAFFVAVAGGAWIFGCAQRSGRSVAGGALACAVLAAAWLGLAPRSAPDAFGPSVSLHAETPWQAWNPERVAVALAADRPVVVYFTADWCITCALNERGVLSDAEVLAALRERGVALFRADWTRPDDGILRALEAVGRAGVPTTLVYHPTAPDRPRVLPELLTAEALLSSLGSGDRI